MRACLIYIYIYISEKEIFIRLSVGGKGEGWKRKVEVNWIYAKNVRGSKSVWKNVWSEEVYL